MLLEAVRGDLTTADVDVVVNAANSTLLGGGGVDGAIHGRGGPAILDECVEVRATCWPDGLPVGEAVATTAGRLPARWVVHTVGPRWREHGDGGPDLLASCHTRALDEADRLGAASVAFPAVSCGVYGWDAHDAAPVAVAAVRAWSATHPGSTVRLVRFVLWSDETYEPFAAAVGGPAS